MFEALVIEQTPVFSNNYTQTFFQQPKTSNPVIERRQPSSGSTLAKGLVLRAATSEVFGTARVADLTRAPGVRRASDNAQQPRQELSLIEKTQQDRVTLLARKYASKLDHDASARLEILTHKLRVAQPRVTAKMAQRIENSKKEAADLGDDIASLREMYGI